MGESPQTRLNHGRINIYANVLPYKRSEVIRGASTAYPDVKHHHRAQTLAKSLQHDALRWKQVIPRRVDLHPISDLAWWRPLPQFARLTTGYHPPSHHMPNHVLTRRSNCSPSQSPTPQRGNWYGSVRGCTNPSKNAQARSNPSSRTSSTVCNE